MFPHYDRVIISSWGCTRTYISCPYVWALLSKAQGGSSHNMSHLFFSPFSSLYIAHVSSIICHLIFQWHKIISIHDSISLVNTRRCFHFESRWSPIYPGKGNSQKWDPVLPFKDFNWCVSWMLIWMYEVSGIPKSAITVSIWPKKNVFKESCRHLLQNKATL